jgi:N4-gp56 family major capsid protein
MQTYSLVPSRNLIAAERAMLKHALPLKVLSTFGTQKDQPLNKTDTVVFRRALPIDASATTYAPEVTAASYALAEGTTPAAKTINYQDVTCTLQNYGVLMKLSSKTADLYEDDVPGDMQKIVGEHMTTLEEQIAYGVVRGGTNVFYANSTARGNVNTAVSLNKLRAVTRSLENARSMRVTQRLSSSVNFGTEAVRACWLVFAHTDCAHDIQNLPGFKDVVDYGSSASPVHEREIGAVGEYRFVLSPEFRAFSAAGAANGGSNTFLTAGGTGSGNCDIYPYIIVGEESWGQVALKGRGAIDVTYLPPKVKTHANPLGLFGYVGAQFWKTAVRLNEVWMARLECAVTAL